MRKFLAAFALVAVFAAASPARANAALTTTTHPISIGLGIGFQVADFGGVANATSFLLALPFEYHLKAGPGELALRLTFDVAPKAVGGVTWVGLAIPVGFSYKLRPIASVPFYVWPFVDIGPSFIVVSGNSTAGGVFQAGGGVSYMVHPNVELWFRPLGLGASFASGGAGFLYTFLIGTGFHF